MVPEFRPSGVPVWWIGSIRKEPNAGEPAVFGDMLGYWKFFPAQGDWGRIPVWGIGTVIDSSASAVQRGSRYYGYFPMSGHLLVTPGKVTPAGFVDRSEHRHELPPVYNHYALMSDATGFPARQDNQQMVYRPLFTTSFMLDDFFEDNAYFGAESIVLASASSKTAFGTAFMMRDRPQTVIGLTSSANRAFVEGLAAAGGHKLIKAILGQLARQVDTTVRYLR